MVMLVSWAGQDEEGVATELTTHPRRVYAIVYLRHLPGAYTVTNVRAVPYQSVSICTSLVYALANVYNTMPDLQLWRADAS